MDIIFKKIKALDFPNQEYIVAGSCIMDIHGLKQAQDIDIVASERLFKECTESGEWNIIPCTYKEKIGQVRLEKDDIEIQLNVNCGNEFTPTLNELLSRAEYFEGIPFVCLEDLLKFKKSYDRPKDHIDIKLIEEYLIK
jgi:hypothetical protein